MTNNLHLDAFCQFWFDNFNSPIPPLPSKPSDLSVTQLELLRLYDGGKLYQNLFRVTDPKKLPANLARDVAKGLVDYKNKDLYREHGWEHQAQEIEKGEAEYQQQKINKEIAAMQKRNAEQERVNAARANMSLMEKMALESQGQTMDQVIRNRMKYHGRVD
tara:strand:- start:677 stop:1159 length:483 start_codon:yes stop_codon:yes gene_type:complete